MPATGKPIRVLVVEDSADDTELLMRELRACGYVVVSERVDSADTMRAALKDQSWDFIFSDFMLPGFGGMEALQIAKESGLDLPFVVVSGEVGEDKLVEVMKAGAADFILKNRLGRLGTVVERELADAAARRGMQQAQIEWRAAFDAVSDPIFFHDAGFRVVRANLAYAALVRMPVQDFIGKPYWEVFPRLDGPLPGCKAATETTANHEEEFTLPGGETYLSRSFPMSDSQGNRLYSLHVLQDVTERNRVRDAVETHERRFRALIEHASDLLTVVDAQGVITYISPSIRRMGGYEASEVLGRNFLEFAHPDDLPLARDALAEVLRRPGEMHPTEFRFRRKDGGWVVLQSIARNALTDPAVHGIVINSRDVTERRRSEQAIRTSEQRFRSLFTNMIEGLARCEMITGADGAVDFVYLEVNPAFESLTGLTDVVGKRISEVIPGLRESNPEVFENYAGVASGGAPVRFEVHLKSLNDMWLAISVYAEAKSVIVAVFDNITTRKQAELDLRWRTAFFEALVRSSADGVLVVDANGRKVLQNQRMIDLWKIPKEFAENPDDAVQLRYVTEQTADPKSFVDKVRYLYGHPEEISKDEIITRDGSLFERYSAPVADGEGHSYGRIWSFRDITERKRAETELVRLNWALHALSESNSAMVHAATEQALYANCCAAIANLEAYPLAWIGLARDDRARTVEPVAVAGIAAAYVEGLNVSWAETPNGMGPSGRAIRTGLTQLISDVALAPAFAPWLKRARDHDLKCTITLPIHCEGAVVGGLMVYARTANAFGPAEIKLFEQLAGDVGHGLATRRTQIAYEAGILERAGVAERLRASFEAAIAALAATVEQRDPYTAGHQRRVAALAVAIGGDLGFDEEQLTGLRVAGTIHDIGKISVPAEILARPGHLGPIEYELIKAHAQAGYDIVKGVDFPWPVADAIHQHHERMDGSGYPQGLKGEEIIPEARILAVADVVEAMSSHRPYRPSLGIDVALKEIQDNRGVWFDPSVVDACLRVFHERGFAFAQN